MRDLKLWVTCVAALALALAGPATPAAAQIEEGGWGLNRMGAHVGTAWVSDADQGFELGAHTDIGWVVDRQARVLLGINYLSAGVDRTVDGAPVGGSFRDLTVSGDVQVKLFRVQRVVPYLGAGLGLHFLSPRNIPDQNIRDIYDGLVVGLNYFGGLSLDMSPDLRWAITAEVRGAAAQNIGRTSLRLGAVYRFGPPVPLAAN